MNMEKRIREIFREIYNALERYESMEQFKNEAKAIFQKCTTVNQTIFALNMSKAVMDYIQGKEIEEAENKKSH